MRPVVVAGHVCVDLEPSLHAAPLLTPGLLQEVGPLKFSAGGCVPNTGGDLAQMGVPVRIVAAAGDDPLAETLAELLEARGLDASGVAVLPGETTSYSIVVQPPGRDRTFWHHVGANALFDGSGIDLSGSDLLHVGYPNILEALRADGGRALADLLRTARTAGVTTSVDLAMLDPASPAATAEWKPVLRRWLPLVDLFTPSVDDLASLGLRPEGTAPDELLALGESLVEMGAGAVLLKAGELGLGLLAAPAGRLARAGRALGPLAGEWCGARLWAPRLRAPAVTTRGAGDAAAAGLLAGVASGRGARGALRLAAAAAGRRVSGEGRLLAQSEMDAWATGAGFEAIHDAVGWEQGADGIASYRGRP